MAQYNIPADLKYAATDEWVRIEGDEAVIGVSDYAQHALSDVVYVEMSTEGDSFKVGEVFGSIESVKAASDLQAPLGGTITAINHDAENTPELVNQEPYGRGWLIRIKPANLGELDKLMNAEAYAKYCEGRD
jgi:glycine cleavage system H protein